MTVLLTLIMLNLRICSFTNPPWTCAVTTLPVRLPLSGEGVGGFSQSLFQDNGATKSPSLKLERDAVSQRCDPPKHQLAHHPESPRHGLDRLGVVPSAAARGPDSATRAHRQLVPKRKKHQARAWSPAPP